MAINYDEKIISKLVNKALEDKKLFYKKTIDKLYEKAGKTLLVNLRGKNNKYNDMVVKELLDGEKYKKLLNGITCDSLKNSKDEIYNINRKNHYYYKGIKKEKINEKRFAICFYNKEEENNVLGKRLHYETPISRTKKDGAIDLVYQKDNYINLIEFKNDPSDETLLRALLEISTYFKNLDQGIFKREFKCDKKFQLVLLLENGTISNNQSKNLTENYERLFEGFANLLKCPIQICGFKKMIGNREFDKKIDKIIVDKIETKPILKDIEFEVEVIQQFFPK